MKTKPVSINTEFIKGFIEALLAEYEIGLGPFLNDIHDYEIQVILSKDEDEPTRIIIPFAIETDSRELKTYFDLWHYDTLEVFRMKVQMIVEQIIHYIKKFRDGKTSGDD